MKEHKGFDEFRFRNELETIIAEFGGCLHSQCWETRKNRVQMNKISSGHLTRFVKAVRLLDEPPYVEIEQSSQYRVAALKELTWFYVINRPPSCRPAGRSEADHRFALRSVDDVLGEVSEQP
ncbi:hypothetical protein ACIA2T_35825 [Amycolatopsis japonica]|uniref:hypothetical protein n=1 Tax=Amycolatopsis japonica TaxID=208439 RepID=UPI00379FF51D